MKILLTGCTRIGTNQPRKADSDYLSFIPMLYAMLLQLGHLVDWKEVIPGDDAVKDYDLAIIGVQTFHGMAGKQYKHGALWTALRAKKYALLLDDWQIRPTIYSFIDPKYFWRTPMLGPRELRMRDLIMPYKAEVDDLIASWWQQVPPIFAPLFSWGDFGRLPYADKGKYSTILDVDPSPFVPQLVSGDDIDPLEKKKQWVLASLIDQTDWEKRQGFTWPIERQHAIRGKRGWGRVSEKEVVRKYADNWGVLSPKYGHAGSGWWRSRFNFALQAESILYADSMEVAKLGPAYFDISIQGVETMSLSALGSLMLEQRDTFNRHQLTQGETLTKLAGHLAKAVA